MSCYNRILRDALIKWSGYYKTSNGWIGVKCPFCGDSKKEKSVHLFIRVPNNEELSKILNIPANKIDAIINSNNRIVSVNTPFKDEEEGTLIDIIPNTNSPKSDDKLMEESKKKNIELILNSVGEALQRITTVGLL